LEWSGFSQPLSALLFLLDEDIVIDPGRTPGDQSAAGIQMVAGRDR
jgi:hypothetical protein